jgi:hypothetical protein
MSANRPVAALEFFSNPGETSISFPLRVNSDHYFLLLILVKTTSELGRDMGRCGLKGAKIPGRHGGKSARFSLACE